MSKSKPQRTASAEPAAAAAHSSPQEGWVGLARDQFEFAVQITGAWLRAAEAVRKVQWDMAHLAVQRHDDVRDRLRGVTDISELLALQVELMRFDAAAAARSCQDIYDTTVQAATAALVDAKSTLEAGQSDGVKSLLQSMQGMMHTGVRSIDDVFAAGMLRDLAMPQGAGKGNGH